ncbi:hypothetical protein TNIN_329521, partial [Trichonephila inaurata madagascariensis]
MYIFPFADDSTNVDVSFDSSFDDEKVASESQSYRPVCSDILDARSETYTAENETEENGKGNGPESPIEYWDEPPEYVCSDILGARSETYTAENET